MAFSKAIDRNALVANSRALNCDAGQVVITAGAVQGLTLVARVLLRTGDRVVVEDPVYMGGADEAVPGFVQVTPSTFRQ